MSTVPLKFGSQYSAGLSHQNSFGEFRALSAQLLEKAQSTYAHLSSLSVTNFQVPVIGENEHVLNMGSTMKKRSDKMNKHKLKKRRKSLAMNTKHNRK